ncbi:Csu type fimbrial protein [Acinetobacter baumannii]|uniref:Csu type fimbrial protein n=1 Tax=Acinetobacter baumannii TaxID=470 RepID=UPI00148ADED4|nr:spore coat U domain-containing protein [Acinetobacter baumannii]
MNSYADVRSLARIYQHPNQAAYYNGCYMNGSYTLSFGNVSSLNQDIESNTTMWLWCPSGINWQIGLDNGQNATGTQRRMTNGIDYVNYELYQDTSYSRRWGNTLNTDTVSGTAKGELQYLNIYGKVPKQTHKTSGVYNDTIVITLTY